MTHIKAIIVDDEVNGAKMLKSLLQAYCPEVHVVAMAHSADEAESAIATHSPDLLFLDIEMPKTNGFQLLERLGKVTFEVIFVTAYEQFALQAFKAHALSYLLKPVDADDLVLTIEKYRGKTQNETIHRIQKMEEMLHELKNAGPGTQRLAVHTSEGITFLDSDKIIRLEADSNYTHIYLQGGKKITSAKTLKEYEEAMLRMNFYRIHNAHIVNLKYVDRYIKGEGGFIITSDNTTLEVSRRRKADLLNALSRVK